MTGTEMMRADRTEQQEEEEEEEERAMGCLTGTERTYFMESRGEEKKRRMGVWRGSVQAGVEIKPASIPFVLASYPRVTTQAYICVRVSVCVCVCVCVCVHAWVFIS